MTEHQTRTGEGRGSIPKPRSQYGRAIEDSGAGMDWVRFGGVMMAVLGGFGVIEGLVALLSPTYFVTVGGTVLALNLTAWGWLHIIIGALVLATGLALLGNAPSWARAVGIGLVAINMIVQLAWLPAFPMWSIILLVIDVLVLYALIATWGARTER
jgi:hypothetical protein